MTVPKEPPRANAEDNLHTITKAGLSAIPIVGGPISTLLDRFWIPSLQRRRDAWLDQIGKTLEQLEARLDGFSIESLKDDEAFISLFTEATYLAIKTHQMEKLDALRNAVTNTALGRQPEEDLTFILLHLVDTLTPSHLAVLRYFADPEGWFDTRKLVKPEVGVIGGTRMDGFRAAFPEMGDEAFFETLVNDLVARGLLPDPGLRTMVTGHAVFDRMTAPLGQKLLAFVSAPDVTGSSPGPR